MPHKIAFYLCLGFNRVRVRKWTWTIRTLLDKMRPMKVFCILFNVQQTTHSAKFVVSIVRLINRWKEFTKNHLHTLKCTDLYTYTHILHIVTQFQFTHFILAINDLFVAIQCISYFRLTVLSSFLLQLIYVHKLSFLRPWKCFKWTLFD